MPLETYTLAVREAENDEGIEAAVTGEDGLAEASTYVAYEDYDLVADRETDGSDAPDEETESFSADVLSLRLQLQRLEDSFEFSVVGDDEELVRTTVADDDWGLVGRSG